MAITLENEWLRASLSLVGGHVDSLFHKRTGLEHCGQYDPAVWPRRTSVCFPVCGELTDGEYHFGGHTYALPIHGFVRDSRFRKVSSEEDRLLLRLESSAETLACYPFPFALELDYALTEDSLVVTYRVENRGAAPMYYSVGSHYAYRLEPGCRFQFEGVQQTGRVLLENGRAGSFSPDFFAGRSALLVEDLYREGSVILPTQGLSAPQIALMAPHDHWGTLVSWENFDHCVLWTPKRDSPFVCIEPWAGMVDQVGHDKRLEAKRGIQTLAPGCTGVHTQRITLI